MNFTRYTEETDDSPIFTPPESNATGPPDYDYDAKSPCSPPRHGQTFLIRSVASGEVITLTKGDIVLARPDGRASHWVCEADRDGWLGFRNAVSGRFLGRDRSWKLSCYATSLREWERFRLRARPWGGSVLVMTRWGTLRPVGMMESVDWQKKSVRTLSMIENWEADELIWELVKV